MVLALAAGGLLAWGLAIGAGACYAGILGAAICASLFASALKWWSPQRDAAGYVKEKPSLLPNFDPRGRHPRTYVLDLLASAPCKVVIQVMTLGLVLGFAVTNWLAVVLGCVSLLVALGLTMAAIWYFNRATGADSVPAAYPPGPREGEEPEQPEA
ncbi:MAG: hypothetical protein PHO92_02215 [Candidatus Peribacteraceae bacterium]|nr:hypothetical protein [Candidatus Peribacteraceae bacterium]